MLDLKGFLKGSIPPGRGDDGDIRPPKISVITPSYNQGRFLRDNIVSVINQSYPNYEHIIIDGGSTDSSLEILKAFNDRIFHWVSEPDRGQSHALNKGLSVASGDIIGWQNSDDLYLPDVFHMVGRLFAVFPEIDVLYGDFLYIDENNTIISPKKYAPFFAIGEYLFVGANISNQSVFFKKTALIRAGGFNEAYHLAMDFDLFLKLSSFARFKHARAYLGGYRIHTEQKGCNFGRDCEEEYARIREDRGLKIGRDVPWKRRYRTKRFYYRTRRNLLKLLYIPSYLRDPLYRG